jgi:hypothetical protein
MSKLDPKKQLEVLRLLATRDPRLEPVTEKRNNVEVARQVERGGEIRILKSHNELSATTVNEKMMADAIQRVIGGLHPAEAAQFPRIWHSTRHRGLVTIEQRFDGLDFVDLTRLFAKDEYKRNPLFQLAMFGGALRALRSIHAHGFLHCDVRLDNYCVHVEVRSSKDGYEVTPNFQRVHAIDFGCSLLPPEQRAQQFAALPPYIGDAVGYLSPHYRQARGPEANLNRTDAMPFVRLSASSDLWSLAFHIQTVVDKGELDPDVEKRFGSHSHAALRCLERLPDRLGFRRDAHGNTTILVDGDGKVGVDLTLHNELLEEIDQITYDWACKGVVVDAPPEWLDEEEETKIIVPVLPWWRAPSVRRIAPVVAGVAAIGLAGGVWQLQSVPAKPAVAPLVTMASKPVAVVLTERPASVSVCRLAASDLEASIIRGQSPDPALQATLRTSLDACRQLLAQPDRLGDDLRRVLVSAGYYALHLGLPAESEKYARLLQHRLPDEYMGYFLDASLRAREGNAAATLEALTRAADRGMPRKAFEDGRPDFAFLANHPGLASLERKFAKH